MSIESPERFGGEVFDRDKAAAHVTENGTLAAAALQYARERSSGNPVAQERYMEWLKHPESWDEYGMSM